MGGLPQAKLGTFLTLLGIDIDSSDVFMNT